MLRKYLKKAGIGRAGIHTLRHPFEAYYTSHGTSLKTIQEVKGQKDRRSTLIYASLAREI
jgi:site-specific recombinase XerD